MRLVWGSVAGHREGLSDYQLLASKPDDGDPGDCRLLPVARGAPAGWRPRPLNTTAVGLGLGTGGRHFVVARADGIEGVAFDEPSGGHIMKLRYTPMQRDVLAVESPESPHHAAMSQARASRRHASRLLRPAQPSASRGGRDQAARSASYVLHTA